MIRAASGACGTSNRRASILRRVPRTTCATTSTDGSPSSRSMVRRSAASARYQHSGKALTASSSSCGCNVPSPFAAIARPARMALSPRRVRRARHLVLNGRAERRAPSGSQMGDSGASRSGHPAMRLASRTSIRYCVSRQDADLWTSTFGRMIGVPCRIRSSRRSWRAVFRGPNKSGIRRLFDAAARTRSCANARSVHGLQAGEQSAAALSPHRLLIMTHDSPQRPTTAGSSSFDRRGSSRVDDLHFRSSDGTRWTVGERGDGDGSAKRMSLVFESTDSARRVREYPANWRELSPAELEALSWRK